MKAFNVEVLKKVLNKEVVTLRAEKVLIEKTVDPTDIDSVANFQNDSSSLVNYEKACSTVDTLEWIIDEVESIEKTGEEL